MGSDPRWRLALAGALLLGTGVAAAQPVIPPGQETRVLELLEPHGFGAQIDGWHLEAVAIERSFVRITVAGPAETAVLRLEHPDVSEATERTASFAVEREATSEAARAALDPWVAAIRANDDGTFWTEVRSVGRDGSPSAPRSSLDPIDLPLPTLLAVFLGLSLVLLERRRLGPDPARRLPPPVVGRRRWALALVFTVAVALALFFTADAPPLHPDTNRDLLLARDCLERGVCLGPSTSFGGLQQHAGWIRLLTLLRAMGLDPVGAHRVLIVFDALGAGVLASLAARRLPLSLAAVVAAVAFSWLMWAAEFPILWNPTLAPLAYAVLYAGVLDHRWAVAGSLAGLGAVAAVETHIAGLVATAVLVLGLRALADRPGRAVALGLALFVGLEGVLSSRAIGLNLDASIAPLVLPALPLALTVSWLVGGWLRRRIESRSALELAVLALAALGTTGPPLVAALAAGHFLSARYFALAVVPLAGLSGAALARLMGRHRAGAAVLAASALAFSMLPWSEAAQRQYYDLGEVAVLADALDVRERHADVRVSLQGPLAPLLGEGFAVWARDASFEPREASALRVVRVADEGMLPEGWRALPLPSGMVGGLSERESRLRPLAAELCLASGGEPACLVLTPEMWRVFGGDRDTYERLSSGILPAAERLRERVSEEGETLRLFARIPVRAGGVERTLQLFDELDGSGWRIAGVDGVAHRGELGGQRIVLGAGRGTLTLEHTEPVHGHVPVPLLNAIELEAGELGLLEVLCEEHPGC